MTKLLDKVFSEASKLPDAEQDSLAAWLLEELRSERRWDKALAGSLDELEDLADEALTEHREGRTRPLDH